MKESFIFRIVRSRMLVPRLAFPRAQKDTTFGRRPIAVATNSELFIEYRARY